MVSPLNHPILPAGYNADPVNGDEFGGAGTNAPIDVMTFDAFDPKTMIILTDEMIAGFNGCADLVVGCESDTVTIAAQADTMVVRR